MLSRIIQHPRSFWLHVPCVGLMLYAMVIDNPQHHVIVCSWTVVLGSGLSIIDCGLLVIVLPLIGVLYGTVFDLHNVFRFAICKNAYIFMTISKGGRQTDTTVLNPIISPKLKVAKFYLIFVGSLMISIKFY